MSMGVGFCVLYCFRFGSLLNPPLFILCTFPFHRYATLVTKHGNLQPTPVCDDAGKQEAHVLLHFDEKRVQLLSLNLRQTVMELKQELGRKFDVHPGPYAIQMRSAAQQERLSLDEPEQSLQDAKLRDGDDVYFIKRSALSNYVHMYGDNTSNNNNIHNSNHLSVDCKEE